MLTYHLTIIALFLLTTLLLALILYTLSIVLFSTGVNDELAAEKRYAYECGYNSFSDAREAFEIKFYLVAILFLIFDLEVSFLMPLATSLAGLNVSAFLSVTFFIIILTVGFIYEWKKGGLDW